MRDEGKCSRHVFYVVRVPYNFLHNIQKVGNNVSEKWDGRPREILETLNFEGLALLIFSVGSNQDTCELNLHNIKIIFIKAPFKYPRDLLPKH